MVVKTLLNAVKGSKVPKGPKVKTYYKLKPDTDITQFKKSEKHSLGKKNRCMGKQRVWKNI